MMESFDFSFTWWQLIVGLVGTFGGLEGIKWLVNRKRIARDDEFRALRDTVEFLQAQLKEKELRFADQTALLRTVQRELLSAEKESAKKEIAYEREVAALRIELAEVRCEEADCPFRRPPNAHTPAPKGLTKEQHFNKD